MQYRNSWKKNVLLVLLVLGCACAGGLETARAQSDGQGTDVFTSLEDINKVNAKDKQALLSAVGIEPGGHGLPWAKVIAYVLFGSIGFVAFAYGKKQESLKPLMVGLVLMGYPYFINNAILLYVVGAGLCVLLYFWRD